MPRDSDAFMTRLAQITGYGIGLLWSALGVLSLKSAADGFLYDRLDWGVGWGLVGILLLAAGVISLVGTWWHLNRVRPRSEF